MGRVAWRDRLGALARAVGQAGRPQRSGRTTAVGSGSPPPPRPHDYAGDFQGVPTVVYAPVDDGHPDPGEVVWAWVPYEDDPSQGKDRPVLVIGRDRGYLLALAFTSQDHDRDAAQEARAGRFWFEVGGGAWDPSGRPSEVRLDRVLRLDPTAVRREGATLDRARFDALAAAVHARLDGR